MRGKRAIVQAVIEPAGVNNEEEGYGRNAGSKRHYYRLEVQMVDIWTGYDGPRGDVLLIEVFETWLEGSDRDVSQS